MASFEAVLARLEAIVEEMSAGELPLDRALTLFEEGIEQLRLATQELGRAEAAVKVLTERADGVLEAAQLAG